SRSPTLISAYSSRNGLVNPRFGMRRWMGICPPSKPMKFMLPVRAFWPLPPRPAVLPVPLACPRPTLFFSFTPPPRGGVSLVSSFIFVTSSDQPPGTPRFLCCLYRKPKKLGVLGVLGGEFFKTLRPRLSVPSGGSGGRKA